MAQIRMHVSVRNTATTRCFYETRGKDALVVHTQRIVSRIAAEAARVLSEKTNALQRLIRLADAQAAVASDRLTDRAVSLKLAMASLAVGRPANWCETRKNNRRVRPKEIRPANAEYID